MEHNWQQSNFVDLSTFFYEITYPIKASLLACDSRIFFNDTAYTDCLMQLGKFLSLIESTIDINTSSITSENPMVIWYVNSLSKSIKILRHSLWFLYLVPVVENGKKVSVFQNGIDVFDNAIGMIDGATNIFFNDKVDSSIQKNLRSNIYRLYDHCSKVLSFRRNSMSFYEIYEGIVYEPNTPNSVVDNESENFAGSDEATQVIYLSNGCDSQSNDHSEINTNTTTSCLPEHIDTSETIRYYTSFEDSVSEMDIANNSACESENEFKAICKNSENGETAVTIQNAIDNCEKGLSLSNHVSFKSHDDSEECLKKTSSSTDCSHSESTNQLEKFKQKGEEGVSKLSSSEFKKTEMLGEIFDSDSVFKFFQIEDYFSSFFELSRTEKSSLKENSRFILIDETTSQDAFCTACYCYNTVRNEARSLRNLIGHFQGSQHQINSHSYGPAAFFQYNVSLLQFFNGKFVICSLCSVTIFCHLPADLDLLLDHFESQEHVRLVRKMFEEESTDGKNDCITLVLKEPKQNLMPTETNFVLDKEKDQNRIFGTIAPKNLFQDSFDLNDLQCLSIAHNIQFENVAEKINYQINYFSTNVQQGSKELALMCKLCKEIMFASKVEDHVNTQKHLLNLAAKCVSKCGAVVSEISLEYSEFLDFNSMAQKYICTLCDVELTSSKESWVKHFQGEEHESKVKESETQASSTEEEFASDSIGDSDTCSYHDEICEAPTSKPHTMNGLDSLLNNKSENFVGSDETTQLNSKSDDNFENDTNDNQTNEVITVVPNTSYLVHPTDSSENIRDDAIHNSTCELDDALSTISNHSGNNETVVAIQNSVPSCDSGVSLGDHVSFKINDDSEKALKQSEENKSIRDELRLTGHSCSESKNQLEKFIEECEEVVFKSGSPAVIKKVELKKLVDLSSFFKFVKIENYFTSFYVLNDSDKHEFKENCGFLLIDKESQELFCTACHCFHNVKDRKESLKNVADYHFRGSRHITNVRSYGPAAFFQYNLSLIKFFNDKSGFCSLCSVTISNFLPTDVDMLLDHFESQKHANLVRNKYEKESSSVKNKCVTLLLSKGEK